RTTRAASSVSARINTHGQTRVILEQKSRKPRASKSNTSAGRHASSPFSTW
ncbi:hypothetical protein A2U01_0107284, partial [Trifolium medium]|nr:hypothetical protein [Trifolium medium]